MGTYYRHRKTETIDVPYSFRCEQCMKDSGALTATILGMEAEINSNYKQLEAKKQKILDEHAHQNLVRAAKEAYTNATEKQIYSKAFKDECPHCHKPQSWAVSGIKDELFTNPIVSALVGIIAGAACYFVADVEEKLIIALACAGIGIAVGAVFLILNVVKMQNKKKQTASATQKNKPVIEWTAIQHILNEQQ